MAQILVVDDQEDIVQFVVKALELQNHKVTGLTSVLDLDKNSLPRFDLILLDIMMPDVDGLQFCHDIRDQVDCPILFITAKTQEADIVRGLTYGADDYICKPYSPREVVARVKTILRRCRPRRDLLALDAESPLIVDEGRFQASWRDKLLDLTPAEFRLLKTLSQEPGKVFSREQLLNHLYDDYRVVTDRTIDSHIKKLRRALGDYAGCIKTVVKQGYKLEEDGDENQT